MLGTRNEAINFGQFQLSVVSTVTEILLIQQRRGYTRGISKLDRVVLNVRVRRR